MWGLVWSCKALGCVRTDPSPGWGWGGSPDLLHLSLRTKMRREVAASLLGLQASSGGGWLLVFCLGCQIQLISAGTREIVVSALPFRLRMHRLVRRHSSRVVFFWPDVAHSYRFQPSWCLLHLCQPGKSSLTRTGHNIVGRTRINHMGSRDFR